MSTYDLTIHGADFEGGTHSNTISATEVSNVASNGLVLGPDGSEFEIIDQPPIVTSSRKLRWFSPIQIAAILLIGAFPLSTRSRALCAFWYKRPDE